MTPSKVIIACIFILGSIMATVMAKPEKNIIVTETVVEKKIVVKPIVVTEVLVQKDTPKAEPVVVVKKIVTEKVTKTVKQNVDDHLAGVAVKKMTKVVTVNAARPVVVTKVEREIVHAKVVKTVVAKV